MSPDPLDSSAKATNPGSQNRYAYVGGDPVNNTIRPGKFLKPIPQMMRTTVAALHRFDFTTGACNDQTSSGFVGLHGTNYGCSPDTGNVALMTSLISMAGPVWGETSTYCAQYIYKPATEDVAFISAFKIYCHPT